MGDDVSGVKKKPGGGKIESSGTGSGEVSGLRRSTRGQTNGSPGGSVRKSQRLENRAPEAGVGSPGKRALRDGKVQASGKGASPMSPKSGKVQSKGGVRVPEGSAKEKSLKDIATTENEKDNEKRVESVTESCEEDECGEKSERIMIESAEGVKDQKNLSQNIGVKRKKLFGARRFRAMYEEVGRSERKPKKRRTDPSGDHGDAVDGSSENCEGDVDSALRNPKERETCKEVVDRDNEEPNAELQGCSAEEDMEGDNLKDVNEGTDGPSSVLEENICVEKSTEPLQCTVQVGKNTEDCVSMEVNGFLAEKHSSQEIYLESGKLSNDGKHLRCTQNASTPTVSVVGGEGTLADKTALPVALNCKNSSLTEDRTNCSKKRRLDYDTSKRERCSYLTHSANVAGLISIKDRGKCLTAAGEDGQKRIHSGPFVDDPQRTCVTCKRTGELMYCAGKGCQRSYHPLCLWVREEYAYISSWYCSVCTQKKLTLGVHSVSQGIESVFDVREVELSDTEGAHKEKLYFVKYKGLSHIHNNWVGETQLHREAPELLLKLKEQDTQWNPEWAVPHRLLLKRSIIIENKDAGLTSKSQHEWLVKWRGLEYDQATWELEDAECFQTPEAQQLVKEYEIRNNGGRRSHLSGDDKIQDRSKSSHVKHGRLPEIPRLEGCFLNTINKLREYHQKSHNAVLLDEQDRAHKMSYFISSILSNVCRPFLIITPHASISHWEAEFLCSTDVINVVVYNGNAVSRKLIRSLELSEEGDQLMLQVLISSAEAVSEDLEELRGIHWEAVVVDCQEACILRHSDCIKSLTTNWVLLLLNAKFTDATAEYVNILSLLDTGANSSQGDSVEDITILKERLSSFIISARFQEYWVPVELSNIQLEQYCSLILSNSTVFSSCSKSDPVGSLHGVLTSSQKCCNHPYIDLSLRKLLPEGYTNDAVVDLEIKANGKLLLLDKILSEFRTQSMKVLIIFQSSAGFGPQNFTLGVLLEDFLQCRFGVDSYEHVTAGCLNSKKQAAVRRFNKERERSFLLLEKSRAACLPSIKLLAVDAVIIYNSDCNPLNDLRALQKITIDGKLKPIKVFRLYCTCTVEERFLIFAKNDTILDSTMQVINPSTKQLLLMWGSLYLFWRLDEFHGDKVPLDLDNVAFQTSLLTDVFQEIVSLSRNLENVNLSKYVSLAQQDGRSYLKSTLLYGEKRTQIEDGVPSHSFWVKLLEGKQPQWKHQFGLSETERNRKRVNYSDKLPLHLDFDTDELAKKLKDSSSRRVRQNPEKLSDRNKEQPEEPGTEVIIALGSKANNNPKCKAIGQTLSIMSDSNPEPADMQTKEQDDKRNLQDQRDLFQLLKPSVLRLCEMLSFKEEEKRLAEKFLEYVLNNHRVTSESEAVLQALQISVCWTVAAVLKNKIDHKWSLGVAREELDFKCQDDEADLIHSKMKLLMKTFLSRFGDPNIPTLTVGPATAVVSSTSSPPKSPVYLSVASLGNRALEFKGRSSTADYSTEVLAPLETVGKENNNLECVDKVQRRCEKEMERVKHKQNEKLVEFENFWEKKRADLEKNYKLEAAVIRYSHLKSPVGIEKLKNLDNDYSKKREDLESQISNCRKELEAGYQEETDRELKKIARLFELVKSTAQDKLLEPSTNSLQLKTVEHVDSCESLGADGPISRNRPEEEAPETPQPTVSTNDGENTSAIKVPSHLSDDQRAGSENVNSTHPVEDRSIPQSVGTGELAMVQKSDAVLSGKPATEAIPDGCLEKHAAEDSCSPIRNRTSEVNAALEDRLFPLPSNLDTVTSTSVSPDTLPSTVSAVDASASQVDRAEEQVQLVTENPNASPGCEMLSLELENSAPSNHPHDASTRVAPATQSSMLESIVHSSSFDQTRVASSGRLSHQPNEVRNVQNINAQMQHMPNFGVDVAIDSGANRVSRGAFTARSTHSNHVPVVNTTISRFSDPLQNEYDRIRKEIGEIITSHEEMKLWLKSECDKEIEEIRRKYNSKIEEAEASFSLKKNELEKNQNMVMMNKFLADAFRSKCMDYKAGPQGGLQKGAASSFAELSAPLQAPAARPLTAASSMSVGAHAAIPHGATPARAVHPSTAISSSVSSRSLLVNPLGSSVGLQRGLHEMRATGPDLLPNSSPSCFATSSPLEVQQSNNHRTYFAPPHVPTMPPQPLPGQSTNRASMGNDGGPLNLSLSASEFLTDIARQNETNLRKLAENLPPLPANLRNHELWDLSQFGSSADVPCPPSNAGAGDVVCLSDDE